MKLFSALFALLLLAAPVHLAQADEQPESSQAELEQMLAPIALYPDTVLSHLLIAATYPLEVVQAARWTRQNPDLEGEKAVAAVEDQDWDPSVKALVAFPRILEQMSGDLEWTQRLGDAFLLDEEAVLASVQALRQRAHAEGNLKTTEYVEVVREPDTIIIEPRVREVVYIPYYDTRVVYGPWHWPDYGPVHWHRPSGYYGHSSFYWGSGIRVGTGFYFSSFHWGRHQTMVVNVHHRHHLRFSSGRSVARYRDAQHWRHNPQHRRGVQYRNERLRETYSHPRLSNERLRATDSRRQSPGRPNIGETRARLKTQPRASKTYQTPSAERVQRQESARDQRRVLRTSPGRPSQRSEQPSARSPGSTPRQNADRTRTNIGGQSFQRSTRERVESVRSGNQRAERARSGNAGGAQKANRLRGRGD